jgi:hypothetical protein
MEAVESIPGKKEDKDPLVGLVMMQEVLGIEPDKIKLQAFLNPGEPFLRDGPSEEKKMGVHVVFLSKGYTNMIIYGLC